MKNREMCIKGEDAGFFRSVGIGILWEFTPVFCELGIGTGWKKN